MWRISILNSQRKKYIIADTPGHVEYTRNMVTGASQSQASIILVDARKGVIEQTYRHFFINNLLRIKDIVVAVNKMDLVNYAESVFVTIRQAFQDLIEKSDYTGQSITFIPISALQGDNLVAKSEHMPWYTGETLLDHLDNVSPQDIHEVGQARLPVQTVIRPKRTAYHDFRGYAGRLYGNSLQVGDAVTILPSGKETTIKGIHLFDQSLDKATRGQSVNAYP